MSGRAFGAIHLLRRTWDHNDGRNHRDPVPPLPKRERDDGRHDESRDLDARTFHVRLLAND